MGLLNDLLVKLGIKKVEKPKRKYVRKTPSKPRVKKEKAAAGDATNTQGLVPKQVAPWMNGGAKEQDRADPR